MNGDKRLSIFFLVSEASTSGNTAAVRALAANLHPDLFRVKLTVLGRETPPETDGFVSARITVESAPIRNALDIAGARRVRRMVQEFGPHIVHAAGPMAARLARSFVEFNRESGNIPRLVISSASERVGGLTGWLARRPIRRADRVVPCTRADGDRYRRLGVPAEQLTLIAPAAPAIRDDRADGALQRELNIPDGARIVAAGGQSTAGIGARDAIIAFDMLRYEAKDVYLVLVGAGTDTASLDRFGRSLAFDDFRIRFADGAARLDAFRESTVVLATSPRDGVDDALAAMAAGKPVVGWATPDLAEIVEEKATGLLVPVGDRAALAASTKAILDNPPYGRRLGEAGRSRAAERFNRARMVEQYSRLYQELVSGARAFVES